MGKKKPDVLRIVATHLNKPDVQPLDTDRVQFHAKGGVPLFEVRAGDGYIEIRGLGGMLAGELCIFPRSGNSISIMVKEP